MLTGTVLKSSDYGQTLSYVSGLPKESSWKSLVCDENGTILTVHGSLYNSEIDAYINAIYQSSDAGESWTLIANQLPVRKMVANKDSSLILMVAVEGIKISKCAYLVCLKQFVNFRVFVAVVQDIVTKSDGPPPTISSSN